MNRRMHCFTKAPTPQPSNAYGDCEDREGNPHSTAPPARETPRTRRGRAHAFRLGMGYGIFLSGALLMWSGTAVSLAASQPTASPAEQSKFQLDRQAILAMAGNYRVTFNFRETVSFAEHYQLQKPYEADGHEIVRVIRDDGETISLQHILVVDGIWDDQMPIKHWRQDWVFEPKEIFEYIGRHIWRTRQLEEAERHGNWAQFVYQVDDSPRYAAVAAWTHRHGESSWTSPPTWRPLPRRERTKRDDYDVLISVNRHALTPAGWVHEQDSSKTILRHDPKILAREIGVNTYTASQAFKVQIADDYWNETKAFWGEIRDEWSRVQRELGTFGVEAHGESGKLYNQILVLAKNMRSGELDLESAAKRGRVLIREATTTAVAEGTIPADSQRGHFVGSH